MGQGKNDMEIGKMGKKFVRNGVSSILEKKYKEKPNLFAHWSLEYP